MFTKLILLFGILLTLGFGTQESFAVNSELLTVVSPLQDSALFPNPK